GLIAGFLFFGHDSKRRAHFCRQPIGVLRGGGTSLSVLWRQIGGVESSGRDSPMRIGPTREDWLLVIISAVFTAGGVAIAVEKGDRTGLAVAIFFGGCLLVGIWMLVRRFQTARNSQAI